MAAIQINYMSRSTYGYTLDPSIFVQLLFGYILQERMLITLVSSYRGDPLGGIPVGFSIANIFNSHTANNIYLYIQV